MSVSSSPLDRPAAAGPPAEPRWEDPTAEPPAGAGEEQESLGWTLVRTLLVLAGPSLAADPAASRRPYRSTLSNTAASANSACATISAGSSDQSKAGV